MATLFVDKIDPQSGTSLEIGSSGDTITTATGAKPSFLNPAFEAFLSASQDVSDFTTTKVQFDSESFDTDNAYDNTTNYRFTPQVAGKYYVYAKVATDTIAGANLDQVRLFIQKNGTTVSKANLDARGNTLGSYYSITDSVIVDLNGSTDYLEVYCRIDDTSGDPDFMGHASDNVTSFGAYRIGS